MVDGVVLAEGEDRSTRAVSSPYHGHSPADYGDSTPPKGPDEAVQASSVRIERFIGLSSDLDPYILRHKAWSPVQARREAQWSCHRYSKDVLTPAHFEVVFKHQPRIIAESSLQRQLEDTLFPYQSQLMVAFCRHVHPSYPLLDADRLSHAMSHPVLKIALCCIAHPFCPAAQSAIRRELYETYELEVLGAKNRFATLETIEAALLFAQRHPYSITPASDSLASQLETANIVSAAHDLGLNLDPGDWDMPEATKRRRRRIWWALFIHDKWSALALGRPSLIHDDQYSVQLIGPSDFCSEDEDAPPFEIRHGVDVFVAMTLLTHTLGSVISAFYTIRGGQRSLHQSADELYSVCTKIERELDHWRQVYLAPVMADHGFPDVTGSVELAASTVAIMLYRAVLPKLTRLNTPVSDIRRRAFDATSQIIRLLQTLSASRTSVLWWPVPHANLSIAGSYMIHMFASARDGEDGTQWHAQLDTFRQLLETQGAGFAVTRFPSVRLDILAGNTTSSYIDASERS